MLQEPTEEEVLDILFNCFSISKPHDFMIGKLPHALGTAENLADIRATTSKG